MIKGCGKSVIGRCGGRGAQKRGAEEGASFLKKRQHYGKAAVD